MQACYFRRRTVEGFPESSWSMATGHGRELKTIPTTRSDGELGVVANTVDGPVDALYSLMTPLSVVKTWG